MRVFAHLVAVALIVPQLLLTAIVLLLGHLIGGRSLGSLFLRALDLLDFVFGWGGLTVLLLTVAVITAGFIQSWRPFASVFVILIIVSSTVALIVTIGAPAAFDALFLFAPAVIAMALSVWLVRADLTATRRRTDSIPLAGQSAPGIPREST